MDRHEAEAQRKLVVEQAVEAAIRIGIIALLIGLCFWVIEPFVVPILWGMIIAVASFPGYRRLVGVLGNRRKLAAVCFAVLGLVGLILPILLLSGTLVQGAQAFAKGFEEGNWSIPPAPDLSHIPLVGDPIEDLWQTATTNLTEALRTLEPQLKVAGKWMLGFATEAGVGLVHFVLAIGIAAFLLAKSDSAHQLAHGIARKLAGDRGSQFAELSESVVRSVTRGILGVALIQSLLAGLGMLAAGVPAAGLWALVTLLLCTVQIGVLPVMLPASVYVFYHSGMLVAVLFLVWAMVLGSIDNVLKPLFLGRGLRVPMAVIFVGAFGGFVGAGIIGLFVGAVILALGYELLLAWLAGRQDSELEQTPEAAVSERSADSD